MGYRCANNPFNYCSEKPEWGKRGQLFWRKSLPIACNKEVQLQLKGLEDCNFKCLTNCPLPPGRYDPNCIWDDPGIGMFDLFEYPEFTFWRWDHKELVRPEPEDPTQTRCPRCLSVQSIIGYPYMECKNCGYNEPLINFPISEYYHLAFLQEGVNE